MENQYSISNPIQPLISVVITTDKHQSLLSRCLKALNRQKIEKEVYEVIVVNADEDLKIEKRIRRAFPNVRYYSLKENKGYAAARNYGWLTAKGKLIAFTGDDCIPDKNWLHEIYNNYNNETEIAFTGRVQVPLPQFPTDFELSIAKNAEATFSTINCICSKASLIKVGGFDERFKMVSRADSDLEFKLLSEKVSIIKLNSAIVIHPVKKASWGISIREQKKSMFNALLYKKFPILYRQKNTDEPPYYYYLMILLFLGMIYGIVSANFFILETTLLGYSSFFLWFTFKRLKKTSRRVEHIAEMLVTSMVIPFVSVYWQWYGAFKYKVLIR